MSASVWPQEFDADFGERALPKASSSWVASLFPPATVVFLVLWVLLLLVGRSKLFQDPGTFWHTALGERLLAAGEFNRVDSFTFTFSGQRWLTLQWLGEALMAVAYRIGGWDTQLLLAVTVLAGTYAWLASRLTRAGLHWLPATGVMVLVIAASSHHFHVRPHLATIALMGLTMGLLCDVESGRAPARRLWWLVPVFAVWANLHGGVLGGLITVGLAAVGWCGWWIVQSLRGSNIEHRTSNIEHRRKDRTACSSTSDVRCSMFDVRPVLLCGVFISLAASLLVNPYGLEMPRAWLAILSMPLPDLIQEHRPLNLLRPEGVMIALLAGGYLWLFVDTVIHRRQLGVTWLLPLVWLLLAWTRVRHAPLFAISAAVAFAAMLPHSRFAGWLAKWELFVGRTTGGSALVPRGSTPATRSIKGVLIPATVVTAALLIQSLGVTLPVVGRGWARHDTGRWPVEMLPELKKLEAEEPGAPIFNTLDFGGFLAFHTPRLKTFIDDRCELFGGEFLSAYAGAERQRPEQIDDWAEQYGFRVALVRTGSPFDRFLRANSSWHMVRGTRAATLYQRTEEDGELTQSHQSRCRAPRSAVRGGLGADS